MLPTALLETHGARSGRLRRNVVIYFHDDERVTIIASKLGAAEHPSWFHNARANPDVQLGGQPFRAEVVDDEPSRERLWVLADRVFRPTPPTGSEPPAWAAPSPSSSSCPLVGGCGAP